MELLRSISYLSGLDEATLKALARVAVRRRYDAGQMIFVEGEPCAGLFIVERGRVKIFKLSPGGREQILHIFGAGEGFNDVAVLDGGPNPVNVMALEPTSVLVIDRPSMVDLLERYPALSRAVIENLASRARHLVSLVEDLSLRTVVGRLAKLLLEQASEEVDLERVPRGLTHAQMAARLGTVREVITRSLHKLEDEGIIKIERHRIVILDREALEVKAIS
ncbi:MAG: Crp/Fnr family transcriptional regulator [Anaerolineae bacterium]